MAFAQVSLGVYFHNLAQKEPKQSLQTAQEKLRNTTDCDNETLATNIDDIEVIEESDIAWIPLPLLMIFTASFNLGLGSLTWVIATEVDTLKLHL